MTLRKAVLGCGLLAAVFLLLGLLILVPPRWLGTLGWLVRDRVALLPIQGVLLSDEAVLFELRRFLDDPSVRAIVTPPEPRRSLLEVVLGVHSSDLADRLRAGAEQFQGPRLRYIAH